MTEETTKKVRHNLLIRAEFVKNHRRFRRILSALLLRRRGHSTERLIIIQGVTYSLSFIVKNIGEAPSAPVLLEGVSIRSSEGSDLTYSLDESYRVPALNLGEEYPVETKWNAFQTHLRGLIWIQCNI